MSVSGKVAPETLKPAPLAVPALTVTGPVPVDDNVIVCVVAEFTFSFPKLRLDELKLSVAVPAFSCKARVWLALPAVAVRVTAVAVLTEETVAVKVAVVAPAATVTEAGTETSALLLLPRLTTNPPVAAAAFNAAVQLSVPAPVIEPFAQVKPASTGTPVPLRPITVELPEEELLLNVSEPEAVPAALGLNCTVSVAVWFGLSVNGKAAPETANPLPLSASALIVTADAPVELSVIDCVAAEFTDTLPNDRLLALRPNV